MVVGIHIAFSKALMLVIPPLTPLYSALPYPVQLSPPSALLSIITSSSVLCIKTHSISITIGTLQIEILENLFSIQ